MVPSIDSARAVCCPLQVGDVTIHDPMTLHHAGANEFPTVRPAWILHFSAFGHLRALAHPKSIAARVRALRPSSRPGAAPTAVLGVAEPPREVPGGQRADDADSRWSAEFGVAGQGRAVHVGGHDAALYGAIEAVPGAVARALGHAGRAVRACGPSPFRRGGSRSRSVAASRPSSRGVAVTSPMVRSACGDVVTSSTPTPSTRSPTRSHTSGRAPGSPRRSPAPGRPLDGALQAGVSISAGGQPLGGVLGAAERVEVERIGHRVGQRDLDDLGPNPAHPQPLSQHDRVAAVAVGAHHVGQHQPDPHGRLAHGSRRFSCRNAV